MFKKGIIILLVALIITNIINIGKVKAYEEKLTSNEVNLKQEVLQESNTQKIQSIKSQEINESKNTNTNDETRTFECKFNIYNSEYGHVEGIRDGETIKHTTYFSNLSTSWDTTTATLDENNLPNIKNIKITPKSGYEWRCELKDFTWEEQGVLETDKTISLKNGNTIKNNEKYSENTMLIKPITHNTWSEFQPKDVQGEINITFYPKEDTKKSISDTNINNMTINENNNQSIENENKINNETKEEVSVEIENLGNIENLQNITRTYNKEKQEVNYNIINKNGEIIYSDKAKFIKKILGISIKTEPKNIGKYTMIIKFEGNENYKPLKIEKEFIITKDNKTSKSNNVKGHWAEENIKDFANKGYIFGYDEENYEPNGEITRAEFVSLVNKVFNFKEKGTVEFKDVNKENWFYEDISIGVKAGYINGKSKDIFAPNDKITREEAMTILTNISNNKDNNLDKLKHFKDSNNVSHWAKSSVEGAIEAGYLNGYINNTIKPKSNMTRAEAISILSRIK